MCPAPVLVWELVPGGAAGSEGAWSRQSRGGVQLSPLGCSDMTLGRAPSPSLEGSDGPAAVNTALSIAGRVERGEKGKSTWSGRNESTLCYSIRWDSLS